MKRRSVHSSDRSIFNARSLYGEAYAAKNLIAAMPVNRLRLAIAVQTASDLNSTDRRKVIAAYSWVMSHESECPYSCVAICADFPDVIALSALREFARRKFRSITCASAAMAPIVQAEQTEAEQTEKEVDATWA